MKLLNIRNPAALSVLLLIGVFLSFTSVFYPLKFLSVLDAKRVLQISIFAIIAIIALISPTLRNSTMRELENLKRTNILIFTLFILVGLISALRLEHPAYALLDVSQIVVMLFLVFVVAASRNLTEPLFDQIGLAFLVFFGFGVFFQEFMGILTSWVFGSEFSYLKSLIHFAHPRFFNHLQTWSIPILAALPLVFPKRRFIKTICILSLGLQWFLILLTSARGSATSLVLAMAIIAILKPSQIRFWAKYQVSGFLVALLIYSSIFTLNAHIVPNSENFYENTVGRSMLNTSGRSEFWKASVNDALANPLLGSGPSRYACESETYLPAHPHSVLFRIMGEWGFIAVALLLLLVFKVAAQFTRAVKHSANSNPDLLTLKAVLGISLIAGCIHASVSSIFIMPASQAAAVLILGWNMSLYFDSNSHEHTITSRKHSWQLAALTIGVILACSQAIFTLFEVDHLQQRTAIAATYGPMSPRFWQDGKVCDYSYNQTVK